MITSGVADITEIELMKRIRKEWGALIESTCEMSSVKPEFLAALIAGESGGDPHVIRFEKGVLASLWAVLQGREAAYGSITRSDITDIVCKSITASLPNSPSQLGYRVMDVFQVLDGLATSWGLTQIMGYEAIPFSLQLLSLVDPGYGLRITTRMLGDLSKRWGLDLGKDFSELFDAWNTGRPHSPTADPKYIPNGLARMAIYESLSQTSQNAAAPATGTVSSPATIRQDR